MAENKIEPKPYKPRVYRIKSAPFENPFLEKTQLVYKNNFYTQVNMAIKEQPMAPVYTNLASRVARESSPAFTDSIQISSRQQSLPPSRTSNRASQASKTRARPAPAPIGNDEEISGSFDGRQADATESKGALGSFASFAQSLPTARAKTPRTSTRAPKQEKAPKRAAKAKMGLRSALALALCAGIFIFSGYKFLEELIPQVKAAQEMRDIRKIVDVGGSDITQNPITDVKRELPDWDGLMSQNSDLIGWIFLDGALINHPIVRGDDNTHYLSHTFKGTSNGSGSIFLDYRNSKQFSDQNTIIYGHSMKNGTMFGKLKNYKAQSVYEADPIVSVHTPDKEYHYQIFAAVVLDALYDYRQPEYGSSFESFINGIRSKSTITSSASVGPNDKILTLSTCSTTIDNGRFVVFAVLLNPDGEPFDLSSVRP